MSTATTVKRGLPAKLAQRVADVEEDAFESRPLPRLAAALLQRGDVSKFTARPRHGFFPRHTLLDKLAGFLFEMLAHLVREVSIDLPAREKLLEPVHGFTGASTR
jgi:hypothetical protein